MSENVVPVLRTAEEAELRYLRAAWMLWLETARTQSGIGDGSTLAEGNINFGVTAGRRGVYRRDDFCYMRFDEGPTPIP